MFWDIINFILLRVIGTPIGIVVTIFVFAWIADEGTQVMQRKDEEWRKKKS